MCCVFCWAFTFSLLANRAGTKWNWQKWGLSWRTHNFEQASIVIAVHCCFQSVWCHFVPVSSQRKRKARNGLIGQLFPQGLDGTKRRDQAALSPRADSLRFIKIFSRHVLHQRIIRRFGVAQAVRDCGSPTVAHRARPLASTSE